MKKTALILILIFLFSFSVFDFAQANICVDVMQNGLVHCGKAPNDPCELCDLFVLFGRIIDFLLFCIIPPLAALMLAIGGFMYVFAYTGIGGGGPESLGRANSLFKAVIIGLIIAYGAWLIVETLFAVIGVKPMFRDWHTICPGFKP